MTSPDDTLRLLRSRIDDYRYTRQAFNTQRASLTTLMVATCALADPDMIEAVCAELQELRNKIAHLEGMAND